MAKTKGLKPKDRKLATTTKKNKLTANQWQNTPQQNAFMAYWIEPSSETFGNTYTSGLKAGYSPNYARQLASPSINNKWLTEYVNKLDYSPEHIKQGIQQIATRANNSKSPDDTRLKAYEILAKITGMLTDKNTLNINNVQMTPILGGKASTTEADNTVIDQ